MIHHWLCRQISRKAARAKSAEVEKLSLDGLSLSQIAKRLEIGKASVHRILNGG
jgi:DNA invertase Pin-like site-specific DNA recombinase